VILGPGSGSNRRSGLQFRLSRPLAAATRDNESSESSGFPGWAWGLIGTAAAGLLIWAVLDARLDLLMASRWLTIRQVWFLEDILIPFG
jgi:hypothetical protein